ncbi:MAG: M23 family metallopeptidase [Ornithinimicrobium sp.]
MPAALATPVRGRSRRHPAARGATRIITAAVLVGASYGLLSGATDSSSARADIAPASSSPVVDVIHLTQRAAPAASRTSERLRAQTADIRGGFADAQTMLTGRAVSGAARSASESARSIRESPRSAYVPPITEARVTSGFGMRWSRMHNGIDFGAEIGRPLYAVAPGKVTAAGYNSGLGHHVRITTEGGTEFTYGHLSVLDVERGAIVESGDRVGEVGNSGNSTGAHLHFEVHTPAGKPIDPRRWLTDRGLLD